MSAGPSGNGEVVYLDAANDPAMVADAIHEVRAAAHRRIRRLQHVIAQDARSVHRDERQRARLHVALDEATAVLDRLDVIEATAEPGTAFAAFAADLPEAWRSW